MKTFEIEGHEVTFIESTDFKPKQKNPYGLIYIDHDELEKALEQEDK